MIFCGGHGRRGSGLFLGLVAAVAAILLAGAALGVVHRGGRDLAGGGGLGALVAGAALLTIGSVGRNGGLGHGLLGASGAIALLAGHTHADSSEGENGDTGEQKRLHAFILAFFVKIW